MTGMATGTARQPAGSWRRRTRALLAVAGLASLLLGAAGCHVDMWQGGKATPLDENDFFPNGSLARPLPEHTVAHGRTRLDDPAYYTGIIGGTRVPIRLTSGMPVETGIFRGRFVDTFPFRMTRTDLDRGREQFDVYCAPCHGRLGYGNGMIAQRGMALRRPPANYHTDRLRKMPIGHFYDVITNGYGIMYSYAERVPDPADRWRIAAWIRVLQLSQNARASDAPAGALPAAEPGAAAPVGGTAQQPPAPDTVQAGAAGAGGAR